MKQKIFIVMLLALSCHLGVAQKSGESKQIIETTQGDYVYIGNYIADEKPMAIQQVTTIAGYYYTENKKYDSSNLSIQINEKHHEKLNKQYWEFLIDTKYITKKDGKGLELDLGITYTSLNEKEKAKSLKYGVINVPVKDVSVKYYLIPYAKIDNKTLSLVIIVGKNPAKMKTFVNSIKHRKFDWTKKNFIHIGHSK